MAEWILFSAIALSQALTVQPQAPLNLQDLSYSDCRTWGVFHVTLGNDYNLNLSQAQSACQLFNTVLATEAQVEYAQKQGFEKCRYGWVKDKVIVIPRISPKELCGQNKTGVVVWKKDPTFKSDAYCFRENDSKRVNACEPLEIPPTAFVTELSSENPAARTVPAFSSETMSHLDPRETTTPLDLRTSVTTLTQVSMSTQVNGMTDPNRKRTLLGNKIIYCVLVVVLVLLLAVTIILICFLKKCKSYSYSSSRRPKETCEMEVRNLNANGTSSL